MIYFVLLFLFAYSHARAEAVVCNEKVIPGLEEAWLRIAASPVDFSPSPVERNFLGCLQAVMSVPAEKYPVEYVLRLSGQDGDREVEMLAGVAYSICSSELPPNYQYGGVFAFIKKFIEFSFCLYIEQRSPPSPRAVQPVLS